MSVTGFFGTIVKDSIFSCSNFMDLRYDETILEGMDRSNYDI